MKKKGFTLLESIISMALVLVLITFTFATKKEMFNLNKHSNEIVQAKKIVDFIDKEINYNMTFEEVITYFSNNNEISLDKEKIIDELLTNDIERLTEGSGVTIKLNSYDTEKIIYSVIIDEEVKELKRDRWRDEIK